jgi:uncharacterized DUF497 family protein
MGTSGRTVRNKRKHRGISFQAAIQALADEFCLIRPDRVDEDGEQRWHALGMAEIGAARPDGAFGGACL